MILKAIVSQEVDIAQLIQMVYKIVIIIKLSHFYFIY
jgi:hypothetical protein